MVFEVKIHTFIFEKDLADNEEFESNGIVPNLDQFEKLLSQFLQHTDGTYRKFYVKRIKYICKLVAEHKYMSRRTDQIFLKFKRVKSGKLQNFIIDGPSGRYYTQIAYFACPGFKRIIYGAQKRFCPLTERRFIKDGLLDNVISSQDDQLSHNYLDYDIPDVEEDDYEENDHDQYGIHVKEERDVEENCHGENGFKIKDERDMDMKENDYDQNGFKIKEERNQDVVNHMESEEIDYDIKVKVECNTSKECESKETVPFHNVPVPEDVVDIPPCANADVYNDDEDGFIDDTIPFNFTHVQFDVYDGHEVVVVNTTEEENAYDSDVTVPFCDSHDKDEETESSHEFESDSD